MRGTFLSDHRYFDCVHSLQWVEIWALLQPLSLHKTAQHQPVLNQFKARLRASFLLPWNGRWILQGFEFPCIASVNHAPSNCKTLDQSNSSSVRLFQEHTVQKLSFCNLKPIILNWAEFVLVALFAGCSIGLNRSELYQLACIFHHFVFMFSDYAALIHHLALDGWSGHSKHIYKVQ